MLDATDWITFGAGGIPGRGRCALRGHVGGGCMPNDVLVRRNAAQRMALRGRKGKQDESHKGKYAHEYLHCIGLKRTVGIQSPGRIESFAGHQPELVL